MDSLKGSRYVQMAKSAAEHAYRYAHSYPLLLFLFTAFSSLSCLVCVVSMFLFLAGVHVMCMELTPTLEACHQNGLFGPLTQVHAMLLLLSSVVVSVIYFLRLFKTSGHMETLETAIEATLARLKDHKPFYTQLVVGVCTLLGAAYFVYFVVIIYHSNSPKFGHHGGLFDAIGSILISLLFPSGPLLIAKYYLHLWTLEVLIQELAEDVKSGGIKSADVVMGGGTVDELTRRVHTLQEKAKEIGKFWEPLANLNLFFWGIVFIANLGVVIHTRGATVGGSDLGGVVGAFVNCIVSMTALLAVLIPLVRVNSAKTLVDDACGKHGEMFGDLVMQNAVMDFLGGRGRIRITVLFGLEMSYQRLFRILSAQGTAVIYFFVRHLMHLAKPPKA